MWHYSWAAEERGRQERHAVKTDRTVDSNGTALSNRCKAPPDPIKLILKSARYHFRRGLWSGLSSTCYLPTVRLYALRWTIAKPKPFVYLCVKACRLQKTSCSTPTFVTSFCLYSIWERNCTCSILQAWLYICKNKCRFRFIYNVHKISYEL